MATACVVPGCDRPYEARGWCNQHCQRWKRWGDPLAGGAFRHPIGGGPCSVEGCGTAASAKGLCNAHDQRASRHDCDPLGGRQDHRCSVPGCARPHRALGLCQLHYTRQRDGRAPDGAARRMRRSHHEALADLSARLERLGVYENREQAIHLVVLLIEHRRTVDPGLLDDSCRR